MKIRRRYWVIGTIAILAFVVTVVVGFALRLPFSSERVRKKVISTLSAELDSQVELEAMTIRILPRVRITGKKLAIHHKGRTDVPPLISMEAFTVEAGLMDIWRRHIKLVNAEGLSIQIPPKDQRPDEPKDAKGSDSKKKKFFVVDELVADSSSLTIIPRDPAKRPRVWQMHQLRVQHVGPESSMPFQSVMTNAVPPGKITTHGSFGPWAVEDPGQTPVDGNFVFEDADLSVFKGISGILSAQGAYAGVLERIDIHGETDTPEFTIAVSGHPIPLKTKYHATVDGTNGDTMLEQIDASFLNTSLVAKGGVYNKPGVKGRTVSLEVTMEDARLEDLMRLAVKTPQPPMTGALSLITKFELPPGDLDVVQKLQLDGRFAIGDGRFTDRTVQKKIAELSRRASAKADANTEAPAVDSDFTGRFKLGRGVLALPSVTFDIPGAAVQLAGRYSLKAETIDFGGNLFMDAKISQTVTGWKSLLLKVVDPFFRKEGRTVIPIKISGTRNDPSFGLDTKRVFKRGDTTLKPKVEVKPAKTVANAKVP